MAAPVGLTRERVVDAALAAVRETGDIEAVTLKGVAGRLGIRTQSLYTYVDGAAGLRRAVGRRGLDALATRLTDAAVGRSGGEAVEGIVRAYLHFAEDEPGLYAASLLAPGDDPELLDAIGSVMRPLGVVLRAYELDDTAATHWQRIVFAWVHGFATLRRRSLLTLPVSAEDTIALFVNAVVQEIERAPQVASNQSSSSPPFV